MNCEGACHILLHFGAARSEARSWSNKTCHDTSGSHIMISVLMQTWNLNQCTPFRAGGPHKPYFSYIEPQLISGRVLLHTPASSLQLIVTTNALEPSSDIGHNKCRLMYALQWTTPSGVDHHSHRDNHSCSFKQAVVPRSGVFP